jgi:hypothetical protein
MAQAEMHLILNPEIVGWNLAKISPISTSFLRGFLGPPSHMSDYYL